SGIVKAEPTVLTSVLDHIIDNAQDACRGNGQVTLALREEGDMALLSVSDDGPGMTWDFIETELFKPFVTTKTAGFGIGMYQCRDSVQRWRGQLTVDSVVGRGTTVTVALPLDHSPMPKSFDGETECPSLTAADIGEKPGAPLQPAEERAA
ncbi:MAG: ATP-binding protein, partial [Geminicoccaceae bacterium]